MEIRRCLLLPGAGASAAAETETSPRLAERFGLGGGESDEHDLRHFLNSHIRGIKTEPFSLEKRKEVTNFSPKWRSAALNVYSPSQKTQIYHRGIIHFY